MRQTSQIDGDRVALLATAGEWVLRLREDDASPDDLARWLEWYEADERHKGAFEEMQALWHQAGRLDVVDSSCTAPRAARPALWIGGALAAGIATLGVWIAWQPSPDAVRVDSQAQPIVRETHLPDGSRVEMAARSSVVAHYSERERRLDMQGTSGEAYFTVVRSPARPFIVNVDHMRVRAVGTAFNIRRAEDRVVVTVTEGQVEVYSDSTAERRARQIAAGQRVVWDLHTDAAIEVVSADPQKVRAWQKGRLEYLNEPLSAVIADVSRYTRQELQVEDPRARNLLFSGTVITSEADAWLQALPVFFPVELRADGDRVRVVHRPD